LWHWDALTFGQLKNLDKHLALAISKLEEIKALSLYQEVPDLVRAIEEEIATLRSRLKKPAGDA
jgi:hypothetical protein